MIENTSGNVYFKATRDHIVVVLKEEAEFSDIEEDLKEKISSSKDFFGDAEVSLLFKGKEIDDEEKEKLINIIKEETELKIKDEEEEELSSIEEKFINNLDKFNIQEELKMLKKEEVKWDENNTVFINGNVRSGESINQRGSVVVIGDVNPGGVVLAEANVIVLGNLKGFAHAGCKGNKDCFVAALNLEASQLRIANIITSLADENVKRKGRFSKDEPVPSYAFVKDDQIYIAPLL